ncbi:MULTISPECIES: LysR family substrate-binding domain-containing protein [Streptomyces]|uniref:LysR family substrate-binding domain-containing protein n=1 Tax=Streptomyces glycanivorans TaxID=3033808 RepID=A0ABY9JIU6_9ACTN|nr:MULTISPECIES: LysR family substrate-binding domain-containing protein [unclassified Streptomyces]WSQ80996.1 LysR family substrate-binding domain-containing protein [Streptomyces sp. NBC_01213]TXS10310.1 LysR family transcriptional regulator [Streptomyces sp. wa22]WLQ67656.1 LysR family substrate-binding domain-containing protein [Streptomyces sp. Alt3]WSQ88325.1 LysR family substrate-binding domain-containing protein [Streptomyces sp. NBC_01212]WSR05667.1 LysR family substrate-binding domai
MTGSEVPPAFRLAYVPGVTPTKWVRIWNERLPGTPLTLVGVPAADAAALLRDGGADAGFVRLPVDRTDLSAIPLYTETTVVVIPKDHAAFSVEEMSVEDLADEIVLHPLDDTLDWERPPGRPAFERPATTTDAVELVAAGVGLLVVPQSLARLHHRKDLTYRPLTGVPESRIALSWPEEKTTDLVEEFIGIVRGRTVNSTRGRPPTPPQPKAKRAERTSGGGAARKPAAGRTSRGGSGGSGKAAGSKNPKGGAKRGKPRRRP